MPRKRLKKAKDPEAVRAKEYPDLRTYVRDARIRCGKLKAKVDRRRSTGTALAHGSILAIVHQKLSGLDALLTQGLPGQGYEIANLTIQRSIYDPILTLVAKWLGEGDESEG